jgi:hypothetical protein
MNQKNIFGFAVFSIILILGVGSVSAFRFSGWLDDGIDLDTAQQEQESLQSAVENNDYDTWKTTMEGIIERMKSLITKENFQKEVKQNTEMKAVQEEQESLQTAIENDDYDTWKSLMEAKITEENFNEMVERYAEISEKNDSNKKLNGQDEELQTAIENNDYNTWKSLMEAKITEENFNEMVERYNSMKDNKNQQKPTEDKLTENKNNRDQNNAPMQMNGNRGFKGNYFDMGFK